MPLTSMTSTPAAGTGWGASPAATTRRASTRVLTLHSTQLRIQRRWGRPMAREASIRARERPQPRPRGRSRVRRGRERAWQASPRGVAWSPRLPGEPHAIQERWNLLELTFLESRSSSQTSLEDPLSGSVAGPRLSMKRILVIHYSQTGQLTEVVRAFVGPLLEAPDVEVVFETLAPERPYPFPWPFLQFLDAFPE